MCYCLRRLTHACMLRSIGGTYNKISLTDGIALHKADAVIVVALRAVRNIAVCRWNMEQIPVESESTQQHYAKTIAHLGRAILHNIYHNNAARSLVTLNMLRSHRCIRTISQCKVHSTHLMLSKQVVVGEWRSSSDLILQLEPLNYIVVWLIHHHRVPNWADSLMYWSRQKAWWNVVNSKCMVLI